MGSTTATKTIAPTDCTPVACKRMGNGPPLVIVHGSAGDCTRWEPFGIHSIVPDATVHALDRRGRGEAGDAAEYELEREPDDATAVVDSIGEPAVLPGRSYVPYDEPLPTGLVPSERCSEESNSHVRPSAMTSHHALRDGGPPCGA